MENIYLAALQMVQGIGSVKIKKLVSYFGSAQEAWKAQRRDLFLCGCLEETVLHNLIILREKLDIFSVEEQWRKKGIKVCSFYDKDYPLLLKDTYSPPALLFYRGFLPEEKVLIAIVGARKASAYGKNVSRMLAEALAAAGVCVVSGAARGIDKAAHEGALLSGNTVAVLGCGVDVAYPPENRKLLEAIAEKGAVISEYPPGTAPQAGFFPARNRIINGLSKGVLVVEAAQRSGALITADYALEEGRDVFAVPGSIFSESSQGTHRLLKQGAKIVDCVDDILEEYSIKVAKQITKEISLSLEEQKVYDVLTIETPLDLEEIVLKSQLTAANAAYILLQLELRGLAVEHSGKRYIRIAQEGNR